MVKKIFIVALFCLLETFAFGQACGGAFNVINFFVPNGSKVDSIEYQVYPFDYNHLETIFRQSGLDTTRKESMRNNLHNGIYFSERNLDPAILKDVKPFENFREAVGKASITLNEQSKLNGRDTVKTKGIVKGGKLSFPTLELFSKMFMLKITCNGHTGIYIVSLFGGCGKELTLIYNTYSGFEAYIHSSLCYAK